MRRRISLVVPLVALMCWAAPAAAAPVDAHSAHLGLRAYRAYLSSLVSRLHVVKRNDLALIKTVDANCAQVLMPITKSGDTNSKAAEQIGQEVGGDLVLASFAAFRTPLATLTERIERLHWSHAATGRRIAAALESERNVFELPPSDLCADATAFAASGGKTVPPATKAFVKSLDQVASAENLLPFTHTLRRYRPAGDREFQKRLDLIEQHASERVLGVIVDQVPDLLDVLGLPF